MKAKKVTIFYSFEEAFDFVREKGYPIICEVRNIVSGKQRHKYKVYPSGRVEWIGMANPA